ncbi:hypothetical protein HYFRA_00006727 [Hymenoscyphus fraxineus]|uniref:Uncharacterized protein n=1 Tax=Hymenoscyphus fraxineus TaxID=746836 RepID=A0A9N9KXB7_9HELO|nr:hypothetical protein HYFRA_00006727 [Hymenoscyphus fraxineus]
MLDHEFITSAAVKDWAGSSPLWFACGTLKRDLDRNRVVACQTAKCGFIVQCNGYEDMIHELMIILGGFPQFKHCCAGWSNACKSMATDDGMAVGSTALKYSVPGCAKVADLGHVTDLSPLGFEEVRRRMKAANLGEKAGLDRVTWEE